MSGFVSGMLLLLLCAAAPFLNGARAFAQAEGAAALSGKVSDAEGRPVEGARVFLYDSSEVRRSATYLSAPTAADGRYRVSVPPGRYWSLARLKRTGGYGVLLSGDKHSGDPVEVEALTGKDVSRDFVIADLREAMRLRTRERERPIRISGRILDGKGAPVSGAYAIAHRSVSLAGIPDHLSASADAEGRYTLFLPGGDYYFGSATAFPPGNDLVMNGKVMVDRDRPDLDLARTFP